MAPCVESHGLRGRPLVGWAAALALAVGLAGCVDGPGHGAGRLQLRLRAVFDLPTERLDAQGRWQTAHGYALALTSLEWTPAAIALLGAEAVSLPFDPAKPPDGYSNCHQGHCHKADGTLPTYAEIAAELRGGVVPAASLEAKASPGVLVWTQPSPSPREATLQGCAEAGCELEEGSLVALRVDVSGLRVRGTVVSTSVTTAGTLPTQGLPLDIAVADPLRWAVGLPPAASVRVAPGEPYLRRLDVVVRLGAGALDGVAMAELVGGGAATNAANAASALAAGVVDSSAVTAALVDVQETP